MGQAGISCYLDHFGETGPESFSEGTTVYINRDHPLYKREAKKGEAHTMHIAPLLAQEIALTEESPRNPRQAFEYANRSCYAMRSSKSNQRGVPDVQSVRADSTR